MNMDQNKSFGLIKLRRTKKVQIPLSFQSSLWIKSVEWTSPSHLDLL